MWCRLGWLALLASLLISGRWVVAGELEQQLLSWQERGQSARFQGSFVYERNDIFSTHGVWQREQADGSVHTRFVRMNGPELEMLRIDGRLTCASRHDEADQMADDLAYMPDHRLDPDRLQAGYVARSGAESRVAGRLADAVLFVPLDVHRYPLEVHFDQETGVILKALLLSEDGELLERFQYVWFSTADFPPDRVAPGAGCVTAAALPPAAPVMAGWRLNWLPPGFEASASVQELSGASGRSYGDGLASFSVFVAPLQGGVHEASYQQLGPVAIVSRPVQARQGNFMITVLGEIPAATAQRLVLSVALEDDGERHD